MKTKQKVLIIAIVSVLLLAVIGLTIGLVLVAQQATMNNNMTISYTANNVDATITATGLRYDTNSTDETGKEITTKGDNVVTFSASQANASGGVEFNNAELTASGRAVYTFEIKNTANSSNKKEMKALTTFSGISDSDNVSIFIGDSEATATEITSNTDKYFVNIGIGQASKSIVVIMKVTDATLDINAFELDMTIDLGYDIEDPKDLVLTTANVSITPPYAHAITGEYFGSVSITAYYYKNDSTSDPQQLGSHTSDIYYTDDGDTEIYNIMATELNTSGHIVFEISYTTMVIDFYSSNAICAVGSTIEEAVNAEHGNFVELSGHRYVSCFFDIQDEEGVSFDISIICQ
ncbi:MAG: hypothetical protein E7361_04220 [Clostridiales bacterium]|nr:hypothetical protein [Clostridiales bacterium]